MTDLKDMYNPDFQKYGFSEFEDEATTPAPNTTKTDTAEKDTNE